MLLIQLTGLSGAGKTSIARKVTTLLMEKGLPAEVIDGDEYRKTLCRDLGFSMADRHENIRRLGKLGHQLKQEGKIAIIAAINPYEEIRLELTKQYGAKTIWVRCSKEELIARDTKGLYKKAMLPDGHPEKISNLTGIGDAYEEPITPDLVIDTDQEELPESATRLLAFILEMIKG